MNELRVHSRKIILKGALVDSVCATEDLVGLCIAAYVCFAGDAEITWGVVLHTHLDFVLSDATQVRERERESWVDVYAKCEGAERFERDFSGRM